MHCTAMAQPFHQPTFYLGVALAVELDDGCLRFVVGGGFADVEGTHVSVDTRRCTSANACVGQRLIWQVGLCRRFGCGCFIADSAASD